jgi:predicted short-subunit dehydrogenase-like oxidoreductase (DUF2520 family)
MGVVGAGRLGTSLALALEHVGRRVSRVASARGPSAQLLAERLASAQSVTVEQLAAECELVWIAVPDAAIAGIARSLPWRSGQRVVHASGALGLDVLDAVRSAGGLRGCLHPLQTFPERFADPQRFAGIVCGIEADGTLGAELEQLSAELGASSLRLEGIDRARYHVAAVFASNYLVALHAAAAQAWTLAGLPPALARGALAPLTLAAAESVSRLPLEAALTGPLARGDVGTLAAHARALEQAPELRALYQRLGAALLALPLPLSETQRRELAALLRDGVI